MMTQLIKNSKQDTHLGKGDTFCTSVPCWFSSAISWCQPVSNKDSVISTVHWTYFRNENSSRHLWSSRTNDKSRAGPDSRIPISNPSPPPTALCSFTDWIMKFRMGIVHSFIGMICSPSWGWHLCFHVKINLGWEIKAASPRGS